VSDPAVPPDPISNDAYALFQRGLTLLAERHFSQAAVSLEKAKRLEPDKPSIREALGRAYFRAGHYRRAVMEFSAVVEHTPVNDYAHFCLGRSFEKLGDTRNARRHLSLACGMRPDRKDYRIYRDRVGESAG
jgi:Flp pilus assembly protein TadD